MAQRTVQQAAGNMIVGGMETYVPGEQLKEVDVPVEAIVGTANGAVSGAIISGAASALVTVADQGVEEKGVGRLILRNIKGNHLFGILAGTAAFAFLGGLVRYSRASKHNQWSEKHYAFMEKQQAEKALAERIEEERGNNAPGKNMTR